MANLKNITDLPMAESTEGLNLIVNDNGAAKQIAADKVGRVKSVNGAEPDDNGNVEIEIPEGFSGSWNDLTDKPFYTEEPVEVEVVAETTVTIGQDEMPFGIIPCPILKHGQEYIVNWNGVQYTCQAIDLGDDMIALGNGSLFGFGDLGDIGNNEPFFFIPFDEPGWYGVFAVQPGTYTVSMKTFDAPIHHLDPKYIKDMYYEYMAPNTDEVMQEQTVMTENDYNFVDSDGMGVNQFLTESATYIVTWNGTEYTCIARKDFAGNLYIGNQAIAIEVDDWPFPETIISNEPFFFYTHEPGGQYGLYIQNAGEYTVSIYGTGEKLTPRKIDYKYMPYEIVDDLDGAWEEINNLQDNRMRNYNPSGTGRFSLNRKSGTSYGQYSFAEGFDGTASGKYSHAEGNATTASGESSHAEGSETKATGTVSQAEGYLTTASKEYSHAEGKSTTASGSTSHAEGLTTEASGGVSHAEGDETVASGRASHAEGNSTIASGEHSHAQGKYNIEDSSSTYSHIVGNGKSDKNRSNAHTLDWDGNAWFAGDVYVGSTSGTNKDEGSRKLIPSPATAQVGQTIVVKTVDANGKPTDWECVDKGASSWNELEDKPFYDYMTPDEYTVYKGVINLTEDNGYYEAYVDTDPYCCLIEDCQYKVIINELEYNCLPVKEGNYYSFTLPLNQDNEKTIFIEWGDGDLFISTTTPIASCELTIIGKAHFIKYNEAEIVIPKTLTKTYNLSNLIDVLDMQVEYKRTATGMIQSAPINNEISNKIKDVLEKGSRGEVLVYVGNGVQINSINIGDTITFDVAPYSIDETTNTIKIHYSKIEVTMTNFDDGTGCLYQEKVIFNKVVEL